MKIVQPIVLSNLKKATFIPASLWICWRWANRRNSVRSQKYKSRTEKRKDRLPLRSTASCFLRNTEKRYPYVTKAAAQQHHSRSSSGGRGRGGGGESGVGGGSTASLFLHSCCSSTVVHQKERRWFKKDGRHVITPPDVWAQALFLPIRRRIKKKYARTYVLASPVAGPATAAAVPPPPTPPPLCCAVTRFCVRSKKHKTRNSL